MSLDEREEAFRSDRESLIVEHKTLIDRIRQEAAERMEAHRTSSVSSVGVRSATSTGVGSCPSTSNGSRSNTTSTGKPPQPIEKGLAGPSLLAHVITSKLGDHLPLYRLEKIVARRETVPQGPHLVLSGRRSSPLHRLRLHAELVTRGSGRLARWLSRLSPSGRLRRLRRDLCGRQGDGSRLLGARASEVLRRAGFRRRAFGRDVVPDRQALRRGARGEGT